MNPDLDKSVSCNSLRFLQTSEPPLESKNRSIPRLWVGIDELKPELRLKIKIGLIKLHNELHLFVYTLQPYVWIGG